jgi:formamidopyrimidine-DNA glycosylase
MPELPEVEVSRRGIEPYLVDYLILHAVVRNSNLRWTIPREIHALENQYIFSVRRRAKYLLIELLSGWIIIHLGMSGTLRIIQSHQLPSKHDHVDLVMSNGYTLRYNDPRRFGSWLWSKRLDDNTIFKDLGPEPLSESFNANYLYIRLRSRKVCIKKLLMNKTIVVGIGNIYANESLFASNIFPGRPSSPLILEEVAKLVSSVKKILQHSIDCGGTTIRNFSQSDGSSGKFYRRLKIYGRHGLPCFICGAMIMSSKHNQRRTLWCPRCQPLIF